MLIWWKCNLNTFSAIDYMLFISPLMVEGFAKKTLDNFIYHLKPLVNIYTGSVTVWSIYATPTLYSSPIMFFDSYNGGW